MLPIIFSLGPVTVYSLGFCLSIGFFLGVFIIWRRLKELGLDEEKILDFIVLSTLFGFLLSWVINFFQKETFSGLTFWGGLAGAAIVLGWFVRKEKWNGWQVADEVVFGVLPFLVLLEVGIFLDGSGHGKPTSLPVGIYFPGSLVRTIPLSVFAAMGFFLTWLFLLRIERQWRTWEWYESKNEGFVALVFLLLAFLVNFALAFWRYSDLYWYWLETFSGLMGMLGAAFVLYRRSGRKLSRERGVF